MPLHHGDGDKVLHLHFLPSAEEHEAVSLQGLELELNSQVVVDVGQRRVGYVRLLAIKQRSGHQFPFVEANEQENKSTYVTFWMRTRVK